ncbi:MAG: YihY/virulence factor BrkB family protein [Lachnospiraceae bacterium]|nr:YihY/virulence factor BrkB family protein [Lachnospiraceae bacterium]
MIELFFKARRFVVKMRQLDINAYSASAAFFLFISLVPILVLICSMFPYTGLSEEELIKLIEAATPIIFNGFLENLIYQIYDSNAGVITISIIATIWTAGKGIMAIIQGLNTVNEVKEERNYFTLRIVSGFYIVVMLLSLLLSISIMVIGTDMFKRILIFLKIDVSVMKGFIMKPRLLYTFVILSLVFAVFYTWMPYRGPQNKNRQIKMFSDKKLIKIWNQTDPWIDEDGNSLETKGLKLKYRKQIPGAMIASAGWMFFSVVFTAIVNMGYGITIYGTMTFLVLSMLWMYCLMYMLFIGAYFNHIWPRVTSEFNRLFLNKESK